MVRDSARQMLQAIPRRMAQGGQARALVDDAPGVSEAYRKAMQAGGQQTVDDYYANLRADAAAYLANPDAPTGVDAYNLMIESGISTSDLRNAGVADEVLNKIFQVSTPIEQSAFVTPTGMTSAYERSPDLSFEAQRLDALGQDGRGILDQQGREYIANLQQGGIDAGERAQMLEYATERGYTFDDLISAGVDPNVLFTQAAPVTPPPTVRPTVAQPSYTPTTVYKPIEPQPDIFAPGEVALDEAFRASAPRTAIPGMPGQFDYTPAAKLRPATGSGFSFTPPSVTTRPRSLLSPREIQAYGGTVSASQRFAQNRALIDRNLRDMLSATPALRNASTYNLLRNQVMSGRFGPDPNRVFDPATSEGEQFQAYLASLAGAAPTAGVVAGTGSPIAAGGGVTVIPDIDPTDRQFNAAGIGSNVVGGADPGGFGATTARPLVYGGYGDYPLELFNKGGEVSASRRMLENLSGKKSEGLARDELARFAEGGIATTGRVAHNDKRKYL